MIKAYPSETSDIISFFNGINDPLYFTDPKLLLDKFNKKRKLDSNLYHLVINTINMLSNPLYEDYNNVKNYVDIEKNKDRGLSIASEKMYLDFLSVLKHSSEFWAYNGENGKKYFVPPTNSTYPENNKKGNGPFHNVDDYANVYNVIYGNSRGSALVSPITRIALVDAIGGIFGGLAGCAAASLIQAVSEYL